MITVVSWFVYFGFTDRFPVTKARGGLVVRSRVWGRRVPGSRPDSTEDPRVWCLLHDKSYVVAKRPPVGVAWKFEEGVPAQMSSSSSYRGSK
ncbi:hypothetical protein AVEN_18877-1 [Araneus ventricosus]|uniref:Uncharacterized protein n=1 Tax=Araneus ventricosus TaxID=182803 RepID=A0A4Y2U977_ARAVE|nr:hypothetical protein AVEN_18877-1 [Araneus ventricosus]